MHVPFVAATRPWDILSLASVVNVVSFLPSLMLFRRIRPGLPGLDREHSLGRRKPKRSRLAAGHLYDVCLYTQCDQGLLMQKSARLSNGEVMEG